MSKVTEFVWDLARPIAEKNGCSIWDVEYVREAGTWFLRVYIDREDGVVSIDDCEAVSRALDPLLDEHDPVPDSYTFEVSSAGAERALKRPSDFAKFMDHLVAVHLYQAKDGRKEYVGRLAGYEDGAVTVRLPDRTVTFEKSAVANVRLRIE